MFNKTVQGSERESSPFVADENKHIGSTFIKEFSVGTKMKDCFTNRNKMAKNMSSPTLLSKQIATVRLRVDPEEPVRRSPFEFVTTQKNVDTRNKEMNFTTTERKLESELFKDDARIKLRCDSKETEKPNTYHLI